MALNLLPYPPPALSSPPQSSSSYCSVPFIRYSSHSSSLLFTLHAIRPLRFRSNHARRPLTPLSASLSTFDSPSTSGSQDDKKLLLEVKDLTAVIAESRKEILKGVNLSVYEGEVCKLSPYLFQISRN